MMRAVTGRKALRTLALASLAAAMAASTSGCAAFGSDDPNSPSWFKSRVKETEKEPFPELAAVPATPAPSRSQEEWNAIEKDLKAEGAAIAANPRSQASTMTPEEIAAFEAEARAAVDGKPK